MSNLEIGILSFPAMLLLIFLRVPIGLAMFVVGYLGYWIVTGAPNMAMARLKSAAYSTFASESLAVVPMFLLMGYFATIGGMSKALFRAAAAFVGHRQGGVGIAAIASCAGFGAICGSSLATAATMGRVALPELKRFGYDGGISTALLAAGGTLGILIPPSTGFVIYAILTQESIGRLFLAGVLPGLLLLGMFIATITLQCWINPALGPRGPVTTTSEKLRAFVGAVPVVGVIVMTVGGIYSGLFSPVEASAVGAGLFIIIGLINRTLTLRAFWAAAKSSVTTTATVMLILIAAHMINPFLALSHIPQALGEFLIGLDMPRMVILALILATYMVLGCFLEGFAMLVLTMPIFFPIIQQLGFDPIWFGVLVVLTLEMGLISPPVGVNVFIVKSVVPHVPLGTIFRGVMPFWGAMIVTLILLVAFPQIALILPDTMID